MIIEVFEAELNADHLSLEHKVKSHRLTSIREYRTRVRMM